MKFNIRGNKVEITEPIRKYVEEKIGRLDKYFENPGSLTANVLVRIRGIDQIVEVTIKAKKMILRGEERNKDLYAAIDLVSDKIERQIRKNKTRMQKKATKPSMIDFNMNFEAEENEPEETVVKRKKIEMKPMSEEEAILQMNLIGHEFFVFKDADTGEVCILYKRKDGGYGMIETN